eukprot:TRINITY_DN5750_c2_g1_i1.p1 TRINITY_DN5750_c2_g1~~TRINITY_DN5750_c2_g1_i1.p1  ORF type:complete len:458 (-),score=64.12 TRINITY_DN5750_c2_g1_i1:109-1482(-)
MKLAAQPAVEAVVTSIGAAPRPAGGLSRSWRSYDRFAVGRPAPVADEGSSSSSSSASRQARWHAGGALSAGLCGCVAQRRVVKARRRANPLRSARLALIQLPRKLVARIPENRKEALRARFATAPKAALALLGYVGCLLLHTSVLRWMAPGPSRLTVAGASAVQVVLFSWASAAAWPALGLEMTEEDQTTLYSIMVLEIAAGIILPQLGAATLPGSFLCIFLTMLISMPMFLVKYELSAWLVAIAIVVGCFTTVPMAWTVPNFAVWMIGAAAFTVPSLNLVAKEALLRSSPRLRTIFQVALLASFAQMLCAGFAPNHVGHVARTTAQTARLFGAYTFTSAMFRISQMVALQETSAVAVQFANAATIPFGTFLFFAPYVFRSQIWYAMLLAAFGVFLATRLQRRSSFSDEVELPEGPVPAVEALGMMWRDQLVAERDARFKQQDRERSRGSSASQPSD